MNKKLLWAHLALFAANFIYGLNYVIAKEIMPEPIAPFGFIFCRVLGASLLFWLFFSFKNREKVKGKDLALMAVCGIFGVAGNQLMFFYGLNLTTPINASIIMTSNPILVLVMSALIIKERVTTLKIVGIGLGLMGALILIVHGHQLNVGENTFLGDLFIFLNAGSYAIYLVLVKPLMKRYRPTTVIKWVFLFGFFMVIPFGYNDFVDIQWESFTTNIWAAFIFVVVGTTFLAYLFNIIGLRKLSPTVVSSYIYVQPLIATLVALLMHEDHLSWVKGFAAIAIFTGVYLVSIHQPKRI